MQTHRGFFMPIFRRMKKLPKSKTYEEFVEKFKPKKATDDCYTPPTIYEIVKQWAYNEYGIDPAKVVRPFYPGGDYKAFPYPDGAVVFDNPPYYRGLPDRLRKRRKGRNIICDELQRRDCGADLTGFDKGNQPGK